MRKPHSDPESPAGRYLAEVLAAFEAAGARVGGVLEKDYEIGGRPVRLRFAGPALLDGLTPALAHLAARPAPSPTLIVAIWDSASTGVPMPPALPEAGEFPAFDYEGVRIKAIVDTTARVLILDQDSGQASFWIRAAADLQYWDVAAPMLTLLHWWAQTQGLQLVHAAAVGTEAGGVLLAGKSGAGKSSTALACLGSSLRYISDDYSLVRVDPTPTVYSLYGTAKLEPDGLTRFPHLRPAIVNGDRLDREKAVVFVHRAYGEQFLAESPIRAILLPRVTAHTVTRLRPASAAQALLGLAPSTIYQSFGGRHASFAAMAVLVKRVPGFFLDLGTQMAAIPAALQALLPERP